MGRHVVVVLGSGASRGARENISEVPTGGNLLQHMVSWAEKFIDLDSYTARKDHLLFDYVKNSRLNGKSDLDHYREFIKYLREINDKTRGCGYPFEVAMENILDAFVSNIGSDLGFDLRNNLSKKQIFQYAVGTMCFFLGPLGGEEFIEKEDKYDELVYLLDVNYSKCSYVILNYDVLIEQALYRKGFRFYYPGINDNLDDKHGLYKINGSVNFYMPVGNGQSIGPLTPGPEPQHINGIGHGVVMPPTTKRMQDFYEEHMYLAKYPVVVAFEPRKRSIYNEKILSIIRKAALDLFDEKENELDVFLCGLKIDSNEPGLSEIIGKIPNLSARFKRIYNLSYGEKEREMIKKMEWEFSEKGFGGLINDLKNGLADHDSVEKCSLKMQGE